MKSRRVNLLLAIALPPGFSGLTRRSRHRESNRSVRISTDSFLEKNIADLLRRCQFRNGSSLTGGQEGRLLKSRDSRRDRNCARAVRTRRGERSIARPPL